MKPVNPKLVGSRKTSLTINFDGEENAARAKVLYFGKDGRQIDEKEYDLTAGTKKGTVREYRILTVILPEKTRTMKILVEDPTNLGTFGDAVDVDTGDVLKSWWEKFLPKSAGIRWGLISLIGIFILALIIVLTVPAIVKEKAKNTNTAARQVPLPSTDSPVVTQHLPVPPVANETSQATVGSNGPVNGQPSGSPYPTTQNVDGGRTVIHQSGPGTIQKIVIKNYFGNTERAGSHDGQGGQTGVSLPWPQNVEADKILPIIETPCTLPKGTKVEISIVVPAGKDFIFVKPESGWGVRPEVNTSGKFKGVSNVRNPANREWVNWLDVPEGKRVSEYRFKAEEGDLKVTFHLLAM